MMVYFQILTLKKSKKDFQIIDVEKYFFIDTKPFLWYTF